MSGYKLFLMFLMMFCNLTGQEKMKTRLYYEINIGANGMSHIYHVLLYPGKTTAQIQYSKNRLET